MSFSTRHSAALPAADNRTWSRLPAGPQCNTIQLVFDGDAPLAAQILDESVNGLAVLARFGQPPAEGATVFVRFNDEDYPAIVRTVQRRGIFHRLGLQWQR